MERREPPRIISVEGNATTDPLDEPVGGRRFARFVPTHGVRRLAPRRIGLAIFASVGVLAFVGAGSWLVGRVMHWLQNRPEYLVEFREIVLEPAPPPWIRGGAPAFLERVRNANSRPERESLLALDLAKLAQDFRRDPWVKQVSSIRRTHPNRLTVSLVYREPVARVLITNAQDLYFAIDDEAVILPDEGVDWKAVRPVIYLQNDNAPAERAPGKRWKFAEDGAKLAQADIRMLEAARLAAFLKTTPARWPSSVRQSQFFRVYPRTAKNTGLYFTIENLLWVLWSERPSSEADETRTPESKWAMLTKWLQDHPQEKKLTDGYYYLAFTRIGAQLLKGEKGR